MSSQTCAYVAKKDEPESWHGTDASEFGLDRDPIRGGLGITKWRCPHPPLGEADGDEEYCVFHTEAEVSADEQREELLDALDDTGDNPYDDGPEHRGQFVGATFGAIDLSGETIAATDDHDVRFDHARFRAEDDDLVFEDTTFETRGQYPVSFHRVEFITDGDGDVRFPGAEFITDGDGSVRFPEATFRTDGTGRVLFRGTTLIDASFKHVDFGEADLRETNITGVSVSGSTTCERLYEKHGTNRVITTSILKRLRATSMHLRRSGFDSEDWDATASAYHDLKTVFSGHGLVGKARTMHVRERRARSLEAKAAYGWFDRRGRYLMSLPSRFFTGYGVGVRNLVFWMALLFVVSTAVYVGVGVRETLVDNVSYSVLAFTVAPPGVPEVGETQLVRVGTKIVMMVETFFGTLSIVLLGYILGNRERF